MSPIACKIKLLSLCLIPLLATMVASAAPPTIADSKFRKFHDRWQDAAKSLGVPGWAVVAVRGDDVILLDGQGVRSTETDAPVNADTMFYIASCTKPFNAMSAVALADDGKLKLDEPVRTYLSQLALSDSGLTKTITVRDLLCHRYGINSSAIVFNDAYTGLITDSLYFRLLRKAEIAGHVEYTNVNFTLAGRVIAAVSGKDWRDYLSDRILLPAGMTRTTGYADKMYADENVALPHDFDGAWKPSRVLKTDRTMHAAGGLGTTAADLGRWLRLNINSGRIGDQQVISKTGADMMTSYQSRLDRPDGSIRVMKGFGLGWQLGDYRGKYPFVAHGGGYVGTAAYIAYLPDQEFGMAIVANSEAGQGLAAIVMIDMFDEVLGCKNEEDLLPGYKSMAGRWRANMSRAPEGTTKLKKVDRSADASAYAGSYASDDWGRVELRIENGELVGMLGDLPLVAHWTGRDACDLVVTRDMKYATEFEVDDGRVKSITLHNQGSGAMRFERQ